jgi:carbamate kinase
VQAAVQFVERTGKAAAIGSLADIQGIVSGEKGSRFLKGDT